MRTSCAFWSAAQRWSSSSREIVVEDRAEAYRTLPLMTTPAVPSRRQFLKTAAATVATFNIVPRHVLGGPRFVPPSEKVNVAIIGTGGQGRTNVRALMQLDDAQIIAVADPAESFSLENFYFKGMGGRLPVKAEIENRAAVAPAMMRVFMAIRVGFRVDCNQRNRR